MGLSVCTQWRHTGVVAQLLTFLAWNLDPGEWFTSPSWPNYYRVRNPGTHWIRGWGRPHSQYGRFVEEKSVFTLPGIDSKQGQDASVSKITRVYMEILNNRSLFSTAPGSVLGHTLRPIKGLPSTLSSSVRRQRSEINRLISYDNEITNA